MAEITIKNFKGINLQEGKWQEGFASYGIGADIFGLADNASKVSYPGVYQGAIRLSAMTEAASPSAVTEQIQDFAYHPTSPAYWYAIGRVNPARIYRNNGGTWTWVSSITTSGNGNNLQVYGNNLYYASHTHLGFYDGTNGNANFQSFTDTLTTPRPMRVFNGSLFIGQGRYIDKYDGTTYSSQKLTLPDDYIVRSVEIYQGKLFISADNEQISTIFIWDGVSNTYEQGIDVLGEAAAPTLIVSNNILWAVSNRGTSVLTTTVWTYNGAGFDPVFELPFYRSSGFAPPNAVAAYKIGILICGENSSATASYEDGGGALWYVGKQAGENVYYAMPMYIGNNRTTQIAHYGLVASKGIIYVGVQDSSSGQSYEIHQADFTNNYSLATAVWQSLPIDAGATNQKSWNGIKLNAEDISTGMTVVIKYRLDDDTSFTTLKTFTSGQNMGVFIPIGRTSRTITIRIELTATETRSTRLHSFTLDYTPTKI